MLPISIVFLMRWRINSWDVNSFITRATFCLIFQINTLLDFSVYMFFRKQLIKFETLSLSLSHKKVEKNQYIFQPDVYKIKRKQNYRGDWIINDVSSDKLDEEKRVHQEVEDEEPDDGFTQKTRLIKLNVAEVKGLQKGKKVQKTCLLNISKGLEWGEQFLDWNKNSPATYLCPKANNE